jgi:hypothetical protein
VTGKYDAQARNLPGIDVEEIRRTGAVFTECAHIVPQSTYFDVSTSTGSPEKVYPWCLSAAAFAKFIVTPESLFRLVVGCLEAFRL